MVVGDFDSVLHESNLLLWSAWKTTKPAADTSRLRPTTAASPSRRLEVEALEPDAAQRGSLEAKIRQGLSQRIDQQRLN